MNLDLTTFQRIVAFTLVLGTGSLVIIAAMAGGIYDELKRIREKVESK